MTICRASVYNSFLWICYWAKQGTVYIECFNQKKNTREIEELAKVSDTRQVKTGTWMQVMSTKNAHTWYLFTQPMGMLQKKTFARVMHMSTNNEAWVMVLMEELWARNDRITDLIQQSHSLRSFLTNSWEWSMFGAAWKLSPLLLFPLPYRVLPQHKKMYFCIILVKQNSKRCTNLNFQWLLKLNKFSFLCPFWN